MAAGLGGADADDEAQASGRQPQVRGRDRSDVRPLTASGTAFAVAGAVSYGVTIICNRHLAERGFGPQATLSVRFGLSALTLLAILAVRRRPLLPAPGERLAALLLGMVGYAVESTLFYSALERGTAAAVALLFYAYPAIVTVIELARGAVRVRGPLVAALVLSIAGTATVVAAGGDVTITPAGALFALGSALAFALYLLVSSRVMLRTDALTTGAWVALGAAVALTVEGVVRRGLRNPHGDWWVMVVNGLATASAFSLMFAALRRLGASRTAVVMTMEALSAVVLGAVVLGERPTAVQLLGGAGILGATIVISLTRDGPTAPVALEEV